MPSFRDVLERNAGNAPDRLAVRASARDFTHADLLDKAQQLAVHWYARGLERQDRVSVLAMNCAEYFTLYAAAQWGGFILNPLNYRLAPAELAWIVSDSAPRVLVFESQYSELVASVRPQLSSVDLYLVIGDAPPWAESIEDFCAQSLDVMPQAMSTEQDYCCLMYTSGTTGRPKGVLHTNKSVASVAEIISSEICLDRDARLLAIAPVFHIGAAALAWAALFRGGAVILHRTFDPRLVLETIERERITAVHLVPTMVQALLDVPEFPQYDLSSLRMLMYAAAPMPLPLLHRALEAFGAILYNGYGQTEINMLTVLRPHQHQLDGAAEQVRRLSSVGQAHRQCRLRIIDEHGNECPPNTVGEVCAQSETAMAGYWNNTAATAETVRDGWVHTGDLGYLDEEHYLFLVDRKKDMIISGGENVYSREVEDVVATHPAVREVAVVAAPDPRWGEAVAAIVVLRAGAALGAEELVAYCKQRLASYKAPKRVKFVNELPRLNTGKVNKLELRKQFRAFE